ncbi:MAG: hypothetical protein IJM51_11450 [Clostridia bacterium]|nr:hypothetical protein [Clostridia bacterium]
MKARLTGLLCMVLCAMMILCVAGCGSNASSKPGGWRNPRDVSDIDDDDDVVSTKEKVKIVKSASSSVKYEKYDNGLVSLDIPSGWKVEVAPVDYIHYSFKVYNPKDKDYWFLFGLKQEGFLKSEKARKTFAKYYPDAMFSKLAPINPQKTEAFYKVWNKNVKLSNETELKTEYFPYLNKFKVIQNLGKSMLGGDILRASFNNASGKTMQGLFTSTVMSSGTYMLNTDPFNLNSKKVDVAPLNVYHIILMTAPDDEFNNWQSVMDHCISTITFSQAFVNGFNSEEQQLKSTIIANQKVYDSISDMIMDLWEKRNNSYDITSQKQSDATLGYERVYDTETGDVYRAYNGFTDDYSGSRYQAITDDMYTKPIEGYIQK